VDDGVIVYRQLSKERAMTQPPDDLVPLNAIAGVLDAFGRTPLVALGERHTLQEHADFLVALLHHPRFPETAQAIVVEFGNARYQSLIDRFVDGEPIANRELRPVWRDAFSWGAMDTPIYEQFFRTVRAVNRTLAPARRIRVLLGDPPIDWQAVRDWQDIHPFLERDQHFAAVVERETVARGARALLLAGLFHFIRMPPQIAPGRPNVVARLDARYPGMTSVIVPHVGFGRRNAELEPRLAAWPIPSLLWVEGTWLGELDPRILFLAGQPSQDAARYAGTTLREMVDGYLYLGPRATLTRSHPNPAIYRGDAAYLAELDRRRALFYASHTLEELYTEGEPQYRQPEVMG
jgi:hypothetical protein